MVNVICLECGSVIHSRYSGEFVQCGCPNEAFVDETAYYVRMGAVNLSKIETEDNDLVFKK